MRTSDRRDTMLGSSEMYIHRTSGTGVRRAQAELLEQDGLERLSECVEEMTVSRERNVVDDAMQQKSA